MHNVFKRSYAQELFISEQCFMPHLHEPLCAPHDNNNYICEWKEEKINLFTFMYESLCVAISAVCKRLVDYHVSDYDKRMLSDDDSSIVKFSGKQLSNASNREMNSTVDK